jgi:hypothetical protein
MAETDVTPRMKASDFHPYILEIFDGYVHGKLTKREFIREAGKFAAAGVTGLMILNQLAPDYALAQQVKADDPSIITKKVVVPSPEGHGTINGLLDRVARHVKAQEQFVAPRLGAQFLDGQVKVTVLDLQFDDARLDDLDILCREHSQLSSVACAIWPG